MGYKLYSITAINESLNPKNILKGLYAIVLLIVPIFVIRIVLLEDMPQMFIYIIAITCLVPMAGILAFTIISGWSISGDTMKIRSFSKGKQLKISAMEIAMKDCNGEWEPVLRTCGVGLPGLLLGYFILRNQKNAILFQHFGGRQQLLIRSDGQYYIINHVDIDKLYTELLRLGAKEGKF